MRKKYFICIGLLVMMFVLSGCGSVATNTASPAPENEPVIESLDQNAAVVTVPGNVTINAYGELPLLTYNKEVFTMKVSPIENVTNYALIGIQAYPGNPDPLSSKNKIITGWKNDKYGYCDLYYFSLVDGTIYRQSRGPQGLTTVKITSSTDYSAALDSIASTLKTIRDGSYYMGNIYAPRQPKVAKSYDYILLIKQMINVYGGYKLVLYNNQVFSMKTAPTAAITNYALIGIQSFNGITDPLAGKNKIIAGWRNDKYGYCDLYYFNLTNGAIFHQQKGPSGVATTRVYGADYNLALQSMATTLKTIRDGSVYLGIVYSAPNPYVAQSYLYISQIVPRQ